MLGFKAQGSGFAPWGTLLREESFPQIKSFQSFSQKHPELIALEP